MKRGTFLIALVAAILGLIASFAAQMLHDGMSARAMPNKLEEYLARHVWRLSIPASARATPSACITGGRAVPDAEASKIEFAVHLRSIGRWEEPTRRVVQSVNAIEGVRDGKPQMKLLHRWDEQNDRFI